MSILSAEPDGCGYHYGFLEGDHRQLNVRHESGGIMRWMRWYAYVGGDKIEGNWGSKEEAEQAAIEWAKANPPEVAEANP